MWSERRTERRDKTGVTEKSSGRSPGFEIYGKSVTEDFDLEMGSGVGVKLLNAFCDTLFNGIRELFPDPFNERRI